MLAKKPSLCSSGEGLRWNRTEVERIGFEVEWV